MLRTKGSTNDTPFPIEQLNDRELVSFYNALVRHLPNRKNRTELFDSRGEAYRTIAGANALAQDTPQLWADTVTNMPPGFLRRYPPNDPGLARFNKLPITKQRVMAFAYLLGAAHGPVQLESIAMRLEVEKSEIFPLLDQLSRVRPPYLVLERDEVELLQSTVDWLDAFHEVLIQDFDPAQHALGEITELESNQTNTMPATKKKTAKKTAKTAKAPSGRGRVSAHAGKKIKLSVRENPRREGTHGHGSFEILLKLSNGGKKQVSYEDAVVAGARTQDINWDLGKGNLTIS